MMGSRTNKGKKITRAQHIKRHKELHKAFDELLADFIWHTKGPTLDRPIHDLIKWSYQQTIEPDTDGHSCGETKSQKTS